MWNAGNTTIEGKQIVEVDPLRIQMSPESNVLDVSILRVTREINAFVAGRGETANEVICSFDWLDPNDGALLKILHTGEREPRIRGTIRGMPRGFIYAGWLDLPQPKEKIFDRITNRLPLLVMVAFLLLSLRMVIREIHEQLERGMTAMELVGNVLGALTLVFIFTVFILIATKLLRKPPKLLRLNQGDL